MVSQTHEQALEASIEKALSGICREALKDQPNWRRLMLKQLNKRIKKHGILKVLKNGLSINDAHLPLLCNAPYNDINPEVAR